MSPRPAGWPAGSSSGSWAPPSCRLLGDADRPSVDAVLDADPLGGILVAARVARWGLDPWRLGAEVWGYDGPRGRLGSLTRPGALAGLCYAGANLVPVTSDFEAVDAFAARALRQGRRCSSIVGRAEAVLRLWSRLEEAWGPPRELRSDQPLMATSHRPFVGADSRVRPARPDEVDLVLPAAVAMFTEEIRTSPLGSDGGRSYRSRLSDLIDAGRVLTVIDEGRVLFKADLAAVSRHACQVQGVWVDPSWRGRGLGTTGMAAVVLHALRLAPVVTLYVNAYNVPARRAYRRVGFRQVGTYASVLF